MFFISQYHYLTTPYKLEQQKEVDFFTWSFFLGSTSILRKLILWKALSWKIILIEASIHKIYFHESLVYTK